MSACPACGYANYERGPVVHHMLCAYVGPLYDFAVSDGSRRCPKCRLLLNDGADDSEIIGYSFRCFACGHEEVEGIE